MIFVEGLDVVLFLEFLTISELVKPRFIELERLIEPLDLLLHVLIKSLPILFLVSKLRELPEHFLY